MIMSFTLEEEEWRIVLTLGRMKRKLYKLRDIINKCFENQVHVFTSCKALYREFYRSANNLVELGYLLRELQLRIAKNKYRAGKNRNLPRRTQSFYMLTKEGEQLFLDIREARRVV